MTRASTPWTILVYMAGEHDLAEAMVLSLKEMYRVGFGAAHRCRLVVQFKPANAPSRRFTQRDPLEHDHDGLLGRLGSPLSLRDQPPRGEAGQEELERFITSGIQENPSEHYLVILSGHASGVLGRRSDQPGFAPGATSTLDLGPMFERITRRTGRIVDVLGLDACFMSMCELCWELRGNVSYLVASEGLTPQYGWPYHRILEVFESGDAVPQPEDVASAIVSRYLRYRADFDLANQSVDLAASEIGESERLASTIKELTRLMEARLRERAFRDALVLAHWKAQSYKSEQYVDLWDFCNLLRDQTRDVCVRRACRAVGRAVAAPNRGIVKKSIYHGPDYQHSHGLSIYFPWADVSTQYTRFRFARATGWHRFLTRYVAATRRELRGARSSSHGPVAYA